MKVYKTTNVFEEALKRIHRLFDEFDEVWVSYSGGKDSTVIYELTKRVARERGRLPLKVVFVDQEAEYQSTIDIVEKVMHDPDVEPYWFQIPIRLFNATSSQSDWLHCWEEGGDWMRPKDPVAITENVWGTDRFVDFFKTFMDTEQKRTGKLICDVTGVRAEESPSRFMGLTSYNTYKDITWCAKNPYNKTVFTFHPIYDWSYLDVWKAIHDNGWSYNKIYDVQYGYGVKLANMRVSNLHHETAIASLFFLQEAEPETYQKLVNRISGIDTAGKLGKEDYFVKTLPFMFKDWQEYRDYLLENLIVDEHKEKFRKKFQSTEKDFAESVGMDKLCKAHIQTILSNDWHGTKIDNAITGWRIIRKSYEREKAKNHAQ